MADSTFTSRSLNTALSSLSAPTNLVASVASVSGTSGTWSYLVTAFNGGESLGSTGITYLNTAHTGVSVAFTTVSDATDYRLYRSGANSTGYYLVGNSSGTSPILDNFNTTISGYSGYYLGVNTSAFKSRGLGSKPTVFYTAPAGRTLLKEILCSNTERFTVTFGLYVSPSGESNAAGNAMFNGVSLETAETKIISANTVLEGGDKIWAVTNNPGYIPGYSSVAIKISGIEITS